MTRDRCVVMMVAAVAVAVVVTGAGAGDMTVAMAIGVRVRRVVLMSEFAMRVTVFVLLGGAIENRRCVHDGSRDNSVAGSATCSSMPASIPLMCRSAAR